MKKKSKNNQNAQKNVGKQKIYMQNENIFNKKMKKIYKKLKKTEKNFIILLTKE